VTRDRVIAHDHYDLNDVRKKDPIKQN